MSEPRLFLDFCGPTRVTAERAPCWFNKHIREQSVGAKPMGLLNSFSGSRIQSPLALGALRPVNELQRRRCYARRRSVLDRGGLKPPARAD